jgi:hypothetical protein
VSKWVKEVKGDLEERRRKLKRIRNLDAVF